MSIPHPAGSRVVDSIVFNDLILPGKHPVFNTYTLTAGFVYEVGTVLGRVTATGKLLPAVAAAGDGSQNPMAIMVENVIAFDENGEPQDKMCSPLTEGFVNASALKFGAGLDAINTKEALRSAGIHSRNPGYSG
jgi:hypothetical protein